MHQVNLSEALKSEHFHHVEKGCECEETFHYVRNGREQFKFNDIRCITHDVQACRCGWEWGYHGGSKVQPIEKIIPITTCPECEKEFKNENNRKFCGEECLTADKSRRLSKPRKKKLTLICRECAKEFKVVPSKWKTRYCSKECFNKKYGV